jgi:hypothetical protein
MLSFNSGHEVLWGGFKSGAIEVNYLEMNIGLQIAYLLSN